MSLVCRPTPIVRFMHTGELSLKHNGWIAWHDLATRERFYPRPCAVEPTETLFGWKRARELLSHSF